MTVRFTLTGFADSTTLYEGAGQPPRVGEHVTLATRNRAHSLFVVRDVEWYWGERGLEFANVIVEQEG